MAKNDTDQTEQDKKQKPSSVTVSNGRQVMASELKIFAGSLAVVLDARTIDKTERELLDRALKAAGGNKSAAALAAGMKLSSFRDKLVKQGLM